MFVILSQKVDTESTYSDELFRSYHYPARYKTQLHQGDIFVYYQGNRYDKGQRYYFGTGTIGRIHSDDGENYYAELLDCKRFSCIVPIYLPDGGYIEQLGYDKVRRSINPPWQSSIRPLSPEAYEYILLNAGAPVAANTNSDSLDSMKEQLKTAVREFFLDGNSQAVLHIEDIAGKIARLFGFKEGNPVDTSRSAHPFISSGTSLLDYCETMKMSYSYKPVLILAVLAVGDDSGRLPIEKATEFFRNFYKQRKIEGKPPEKRRCIYLRDNITDQEIAANIISNPVKVLVQSGLFIYDSDAQVFSMRPGVWEHLTSADKATIVSICNQRLEEYYS